MEALNIPPQQMIFQTVLFSMRKLFCNNPKQRSRRSDDEVVKINKGRKIIYLFLSWTLSLRKEKYIREKFYLSIYSNQHKENQKNCFFPLGVYGLKEKELLNLKNTYEQYLRLNNQQKVRRRNKLYFENLEKNKNEFRKISIKVKKKKMKRLIIWFWFVFLCMFTLFLSVQTSFSDFQISFSANL